MKKTDLDTHVNSDFISRRPNVDWGNAAIDIVSEMWLSGSPVEEIRVALFRRGIDKSRHAIIGKAHRLGLGDHPKGRHLKRLVSLENSARRKRVEARRRPRASRPIPPKALPLPPPQIEDVARVQFQDLTPTMCKWPVGEPGKPGFGFCGCEKPSSINHPYCAAHEARAWNKTRECF